MSIIHVVAGAILDQQGNVLLTRRHDDSHQGGLWEFPGGKVEYGEAVQQALARELREELGIEVQSSRPLIKVTHHYDDVSVCLDVHVVDQINGKPQGLEGQPLEWRVVNDLDGSDMPAADIPIINALKLPERYLITGKFDTVEYFVQRLERALDNGIRLIQLRIKPDWHDKHVDEYSKILEAATSHCRDAGAILMLNVPENAATGGVHNIHADSRRLHQLDARPGQGWFSASCHTVEDLQRAEAIDADFAVLSPVQYTKSHPDAEPLGWELFSNMIDQVNIPVYALGGVDASHIEQARSSGAQGVAGIGAFWLNNFE